MSWKPNITVATIVEQDGRFLFVEELDSGAMVFNQPAGHVEPGESITSAAIRETLEETQWQVELTHFIGVYCYTSPNNGTTYLRFCFSAKTVGFLSESIRDSDISHVHWFTPAEIRSKSRHMRSPLVLKCLEDYLAGKRYPLATIYEHDFISGE